MNAQDQHRILYNAELQFDQISFAMFKQIKHEMLKEDRLEKELLLHLKGDRIKFEDLLLSEDQIWEIVKSAMENLEVP